VNGTKINMKGIDYYNNLINELLANGIQPAVTMFHWDLPQYLRELGGFTNPLMAQYFEFYANVLFENFGDRVKVWMTFNEPLPHCLGEYGEGRNGVMIYAPGVGEYLCGHHILISHANVYHLYKKKFFEQQRGEIGISLSLRFHYAKDESVGEDFVRKSLDIAVR
jgi:beta-glucosidase/6-phospho-beta-glucosidase/beta-galactosidase